MHKQRYKISVEFAGGFIFMCEDEFGHEGAEELVDRLQFHNPNLRFEIKAI